MRPAFLTGLVLTFLTGLGTLARDREIQEHKHAAHMLQACLEAWVPHTAGPHRAGGLGFEMCMTGP